MAFYSKIYANAIAKYNEGKLLGAEKIQRLADAEFLGAVKMLADYGYGGGTVNENSYDIDSFITDETAKLIEFVREDCPSDELKNCLLNKFYYSDAKVYYKRRFSVFDVSAALYGKFEILDKAIESGDYAELPEFLGEALRFLDERYVEHRADPREIDVCITRAMYKDDLFNAKKSRNKHLIKYVKTEIDVKNISTAFRCKRLALAADDFSREFIGGGYVSEEVVSVIMQNDTGAISGAFENTAYSEAVEKLLASDDLAVFERDGEDALYDILAGDSENMLAFSPFINYFMAKLAEFKVVKTILVCLKNGLRTEISKRIRSVYD